ncbi:hypothetical protein ALQ64_04219 [Pseudomonas cannabina]|uniref:Putative toxin-antitoxin system antitoxin component, family n=1 Tax=Pseudomonas cannabina TaxID=86840 RepID=A0A0P9KK39_PSECA|nr:putative toxin-antitoxin system antitoxin component, family [Pseudomonas cannabina]RMN28126.1 hypothetical protein ALQ64_04219 [Pseudomonas cannabina]SDQ88009.1 putative toxin-antitoxin system antitoxin component, TIGR02293 family [Pseudomonas cannabina]
MKREQTLDGDIQAHDFSTALKAILGNILTLEHNLVWVRLLGRLSTGLLIVTFATHLSEHRQAAAGFWLLASQLSQRSETQRLAHIQAGFAPAWVRTMRDAFALSPRQMESLFNLSASTLERRQRQQQSVGAVASERLDRVVMLASHALRIFVTPECAGRWMITANAALAGHTPLQACETGIGSAQAHRTLAALESA